MSYRCEMRFARGSIPRVVHMWVHDSLSFDRAGCRDRGRATTCGTCTELTC